MRQVILFFTFSFFPLLLLGQDSEQVLFPEEIECTIISKSDTAYLTLFFPKSNHFILLDTLFKYNKKTMISIKNNSIYEYRVKKKGHCRIDNFDFEYKIKRLRVYEGNMISSTSVFLGRIIIKNPKSKKTRRAWSPVAADLRSDARQY